MTKEELLKPRFRVIADYPASRFEIDEVLMLDENDRWHDYDAINVDGDFHPKSYPHLFSELRWWEGRNKEDMPEYILIIKTKWYKSGHIVKVSEWRWDNGSEVTVPHF